MLRIWMNAPEIRPLEAAMIDQLNTGPHGQVLRRA